MADTNTKMGLAADSQKDMADALCTSSRYTPHTQQLLLLLHENFLYYLL
jgi:hypothetical protein